jgi:hypothetical protein
VFGGAAESGLDLAVGGSVKQQLMDRLRGQETGSLRAQEGVKKVLET